MSVVSNTVLRFVVYHDLAMGPETTTLGTTPLVMTRHQPCAISGPRTSVLPSFQPHFHKRISSWLLCSKQHICTHHEHVPNTIGLPMCNRKFAQTSQNRRHTFPSQLCLYTCPVKMYQCIWSKALQ